MDEESQQKMEHSRLSRLALQLSVVGVSVFAGFGVLVLMYYILVNPDWLIGIFEKHFQATVGAPLAMVASLVIVTLFRHQSGPIEFEAIGFKFKGAAGPVIMWVIVFLTMVLAIKVLW